MLSSISWMTTNPCAARSVVPLGGLEIQSYGPGMSGIDFQAQLSNLGIRLSVVLMTGHGDIPMSVRPMKAGPIDGRCEFSRSLLRKWRPHCSLVYRHKLTVFLAG
jgi:hypothetical protein